MLPAGALVAGADLGGVWGSQAAAGNNYGKNGPNTLNDAGYAVTARAMPTFFGTGQLLIRPTLKK